MILTEPAAYLECQYDRAQALRIIAARLTHQLYEGHDLGSAGRCRLKVRLQRAQRHFHALTGEYA